MRRGIAGLALLLTVVMVLGTLGGCKSEEAVPTQTAQVTEETGQEERLLEGIQPAQIQELTERQSLSYDLEPAEEKAYTLMIYMVGSNLESRQGSASADIDEMLASGVNTDKVNVLIYTGGSKAWDKEIPSNSNCVWTLEEDLSGLELVAATDTPVNTGDPAALLEFLELGYTCFPAENYGLILWDHGGGPVHGFGADELFGNDGLSLSEFKAAMDASAFTEEKLAFVGFDACLMASFEVAALFSGYARYMIASEEVEPGTGWDYSFLKAMNKAPDPLTLGEKILATYEDSVKDSVWKTQYTLSCLDLEQVSGVSAAMDGLYEVLGDAVVSGGYSAVAKGRENTKSFALNSVPSQDSAYDLVDMIDMAEHVPSQYGTEAEAVISAVESMVAASVTNIEGANGVTVYFPYDNKDMYETYTEAILQIVPVSLSHLDFLESYCEVWLNGAPSITPVETQPKTEADYFTVQLTQEQTENLAGAYYSVLKYDESAKTMAYFPVVVDVKVEPDENGVLRIPRDPEVFVMTSDVVEEETLWTVRQTESDSGKRSYVSWGSYLWACEDITAGYEAIQIALSEDNGGDVQIEAVYETSYEGSGTYGKTEARIQNWNYVTRHMNTRFPTYSSEGWLLPFDQWSSTDYVGIYYVEYEAEFRLETSPLSEQNGSFYCQIVLKDTTGNAYGAALVEYPKELGYETVEQAVDAGTLTFQVYDDHAVLSGYTGTDRELAIPGEVEGVPVTGLGPDVFSGNAYLEAVTVPEQVRVIGQRCFYYCKNLKTVELSEGLEDIYPSAFALCPITRIELPESLKTIRSGAFTGTDLESVTIPRYVSRIRGGPFSGCVELKEISVDRKNKHYQSVDGVLFSADGTRLIQYPAGGATSYDIPAGVEIIDESAFSNAYRLTEVTFPEGLKEIRAHAFYAVSYLQALEFPDSLEEIGGGAFSGSYYTLETMPEGADTVSLGRKLRWINPTAFSGYSLKTVKVSRSNKFYSSQDGLLLNKSGTMLILVPNAYEGVLELPDSVSCIGAKAFNYRSQITELVIPDSVVSIESSGSLPGSLEKLTVGSGLVDWKTVYNVAVTTEITISADNPAFTVFEGSIYSADMKILYCCRTDSASFEIPEGVETVQAGAFGYQSTVTSIHIPASVQTIANGVMRNMSKLETVTVDEKSASYTVCDGLVYSADGTMLVAVPPAMTGSVELRAGTVEIMPGAFGEGYTGPALETVILPEGVTILRNGNFNSSRPDYKYDQPLHLYLPDSLTDIHSEFLSDPEGYVIHCSKGSYADAFATAAGAEIQYE